jgi:hypothetical protein
MTSLENGKFVKSIDITFQLTAEAFSPYWSLLKYYQSATKEKVRQMFFEAVVGYWGALARTQFQEYRDPTSSRRVAIEAIYGLEQQINELQSQFEIDLSQKSKRSWLSSRLDLEAQSSISLSLRFQVQSTWQVLLTRYLSDEASQFSTEQKILWANLAYWGALAERELEILTPEQLSWSASCCVKSLRQHIEFLKKYFELDSTKTIPPIVCQAVPASGNDFPSMAGVNRAREYTLTQKADKFKLIESEAVNEATEPEKEPLELFIGNREDDELMRNLFETL